jgi:hypothetical protein
MTSIIINRPNNFDSISIERNDSSSNYDDITWMSKAIEINNPAFTNVSASIVLTIYDYIQKNVNNIHLFDSTLLVPQLSYNYASNAIHDITNFFNDNSLIAICYGNTSGSTTGHYLFRNGDTVYLIFISYHRGPYGCSIVNNTNNSFVNYIDPDFIYIEAD